MKVVFVKAAHKQLLKLPRNIHELLIKRTLLLTDNVANLNTKKLVSREGFRLRVGDYRIIYAISRTEITVLSVAHRKDAYRQ